MSSGLHSICPKPVVGDLVQSFFNLDDAQVVVIGPNGSVSAEVMDEMDGPSQVPYLEGFWDCNITVAGADKPSEISFSFSKKKALTVESGSLSSIIGKLRATYGGPLNLSGKEYLITRTGTTSPESDLYTISSDFVDAD